MIDKSEIESISSNFEFKDLLEIEYFQNYKRAYLDTFGTVLFNFYRNYYNLIKYLNEIFGYNEEHAKGLEQNVKICVIVKQSFQK